MAALPEEMEEKLTTLEESLSKLEEELEPLLNTPWEQLTRFLPLPCRPSPHMHAFACFRRSCCHLDDLEQSHFA